ncbi:MAG: non-canonical purine NTP pyrophosphatase [Clostridiales Family XIII bacterium]|jgi:XTP/dITP diphosphohydrolase|nr:non-canonical purine NTP pyrophosphatase [Clostridiales Family XIII bacterium]
MGIDGPPAEKAKKLIAVATENAHKVGEINAVLAPLGFHVVTAGEAAGPERGGFTMPEETGATFEENALIKARALAEYLGLAQPSGNGPCIDAVIADDSGLCVDALGGAPGVFSARYAGSGVDADNTARVLRELDGVSDERRTARFVCAIALVLRGGGTSVFLGECEGRITDAPRGDGGFGYDPVFVPNEYSEGPGGGQGHGDGGISGARTFAEISADEKNAISHRSRALAKLCAALEKSMDSAAPLLG